jgi:hypothetical protein
MEREAVFAQRAGKVAAAHKNHTHLAADPHGIRQNGSNHSKVTREGNPGRTNQPKAK